MERQNRDRQKALALYSHASPERKARLMSLTTFSLLHRTPPNAHDALHDLAQSFPALAHATRGNRQEFTASYGTVTDKVGTLRRTNGDSVTYAIGRIVETASGLYPEIHGPKADQEELSF